MMLLPWIKVVFTRFKEALHEFVYLILFALMPVWLGSFISLILDKNLSSFLNNIVSSGESLFICATTVGPLMYFILKEYHKRDDGFSRSFPAKNILATVIIVICVISASMIAIRTNGNFEKSVSAYYLWYASLLVIASSLIVWFAVMMLKNSIELSPAIMREDTETFLKEWGK